jgi:catalase
MSAVETDLYVRIVDAINALSGVHPGYRAAHAKGTYCRATFTPAEEAAALSRAAHLLGAPVPALVRFSNGSGDPDSHDGVPDGRGMAVKFQLPDGSATDIVALTLPAFFVRTPEDFLDFTTARRPLPETGQPDPEAIGRFLQVHPEALPAVQAALSLKPPVSYAQCMYNGIHAFKLVNDRDETHWVRYRWEPEAGEAVLDPEQARQRDRDYLRDELAARLSGGPAAMRLTVQLATDEDDLDDPTVAWPAERQRLELGRLEITAVVPDPERDGTLVVFDPTRVTDGIECSADPILLARSRAYAESVSRRTAARRVD